MVACLPFITAALRASLRRWVLCCLLVALPIYGLSGTLVQLLGPMHFHVAPASAPVTLAVDLTLDTAATSHLTPDQLHELSHRQEAFTRHFHAAADASVVVLDAAGEAGALDGGASASGSACLVLAIADLPRLGEPSCAPLPWRTGDRPAIASADLLPFERPPRA
jgi:hypothetical protein